MPAASQVVKASWIPRGDAKGGHFSNATYHDMDPASTNLITNAIVKNNAWVPFPNFVQYGGTMNGPANSLEVFNRYTGTSQALSSNLIASVTNNGTGKQEVVNQTTGAIVRSGTTLIPTTGPSRFTFKTVKNRFYMADGVNPPAITPDATVNSCQPWGFPPQLANLGYQINQVGAGTNAGWVGGTQGSCNTSGFTVTWVSGPNFEYFQSGAVIVIDNVRNVVNVVTSPTQITVQTAMGVRAGVPFSYAPTGITGNGTFTGTGGVATGTVTTLTTLTWNSGVKFDTILVGSAIFLDGVANTVASITSATVLTLGSNSTNAVHNISYGSIAGSVGLPGLNTLTTWTGPAFVVGPPSFPLGGVPVYVAGVKYTEGTVTSTSALVLTTTYAEATVGAAVTRAVQINLSNISWDINVGGYLYAVSYFNPTSGHVTNTSPILEVKDGAPNNSNVSVTISGIVATNDPNYTKIILWRSAKGGSQLFPLAILNNNTGNTFGNLITYTDFQGDDTTLGSAIGGPGKVTAPRATNAPPPSDLNHIAYWNGRFWASSQKQIGILLFSCRSAGNNEDTSVGVPEECWPPLFSRAIPESDGRITGLRTVGENLYVLTDNSIYGVVGSTPDTYALIKVSSKGKGTTQFGTCVIPGEDVNATDVLVHLGNDGRLYFLFGSGGDFAVSYPIQDIMDSVNPLLFPTAIVGALHTSVSSYLYVLPQSLFFGLFYDLERKAWFKSIALTFGDGFTEGLLGGLVTQFYADGSNKVFKGNQLTGTPPTYQILTNITPFVTEDRKGNKTFQSLTVYTNEIPSKISADVLIDGGLPQPLTLVPNTGQYSTAYHEYPDALVFVPQGFLGDGRLFQFRVTNTAPTAFTSAVYEVVAEASYTQSQEAAGASL